MRDTLSVATFAALLPALLFGLGRARVRWGWSAETSRKAAHALLGAAVVPFPWVFSGPGPVWILAGICVAVLLVIRFPGRRSGTGQALHGVERGGIGELCFPVAVASVLTLSWDEPFNYVVSILVLALADSAGALAGRVWGRTLYRTEDGRKSLEGSLAVGLVAFLTVSGGLGIGGVTGWSDALLAGAIVGVLALAIEGIAFRGLDNVYLPVLTFINLVALPQLSTGELAGRLVLLGGAIGAGYALRTRTRLSGSAFLANVLLLYWFWVGHGWAWLLPPVLTLIAYVLVTGGRIPALPLHGLPAVLAVAGAGTVWTLLDEYGLLDAPRPFIASFGLATAQVLFSGLRFHPLSNPLLRTAAAVLSGAILAVVSSALMLGTSLRESLVFGSLVVALAIPATVFLAVYLHCRSPRTVSGERWTLQFIMTLALSAVTLLPPIHFAS